MKPFTVHLYTSIRYPFDVIAVDQDGAIKVATTRFLAEERCGVRGDGEYAEAITEALVDELDDDGAIVSSTTVELIKPVEKSTAIMLLESLIVEQKKRIQELLEANTAYLLRARAAEDRLKEAA